MEHILNQTGTDTLFVVVTTEAFGKILVAAYIRTVHQEIMLV